MAHAGPLARHGFVLLDCRFERFQPLIKFGYPAPPEPVRERTVSERGPAATVDHAIQELNSMIQRPQIAPSPQRWQVPVWVRVGSRLPQPVRTPQEALEALDHRWPANRGRHYRSARMSCLAAVKRQLDPELAREAFEWASAEAVLLESLS
jgi:hypothetical protein